MLRPVQLNILSTFPKQDGKGDHKYSHSTLFSILPHSFCFLMSNIPGAVPGR